MGFIPKNLDKIVSKAEKSRQHSFKVCQYIHGQYVSKHD